MEHEEQNLRNHQWDRRSHLLIHLVLLPEGSGGKIGEVEGGDRLRGMNMAVDLMQKDSDTLEGKQVEKAVLERLQE